MDNHVLQQMQHHVAAGANIVSYSNQNVSYSENYLIYAK